MYKMASNMGTVVNHGEGLVKPTEVKINEVKLSEAPCFTLITKNTFHLISTFDKYMKSMIKIYHNAI